MSNIVPTNIQLPAHLAERLGKASAISGSMTSGIHSGGFKRISIRGSRFRIRDGSDETIITENGNPVGKLRVVVVGANPALVKTFYKSYDTKDNNEDKSPQCYSNDGVRPASDAKDPQAQLCATCPQNQWGSKVTENGGRMKACADQKRIAVIAANDTSPEPEVYLFQVPPSSLNDFRKYGQLLESKGYPPEVVVTDITFDTDVSHPKPQFSFGGFVEEGMLEAVDGLLNSAKVREVTGEATPKAIEKPTAPKPHPVKQVKEDIEDAVFEELPVATVDTSANATTGGFGTSKPAASTGGFGGSKPAVNQTAKEPSAGTTAQSSKLQDDIQNILNDMQSDD